MEYLRTETYRYLIYLQKYLEGDLAKFMKLCEEAEKEEVKRDEGKYKNKDLLQATMYPGSFEFIHGEPIVARSTIPHTLTLFAAIDILGFLLRESKHYERTQKNFNSFFKTDFTISQLEINILTEIYRNGLAHSYFPKLNAAIAYRSEYPADKMFLKENYILVLNVKYLIAIVQKRLQDIIDDETLYPNMEKQYKILIEDYEDKCRGDIDKLIAHLN